MMNMGTMNEIWTYYIRHCYCHCQMTHKCQLCHFISTHKSSPVASWDSSVHRMCTSESQCSNSLFRDFLPNVLQIFCIRTNYSFGILFFCILHSREVFDFRINLVLIKDLDPLIFRVFLKNK